MKCFWAAYVSCATQYKDALGKTLDQIDVIKRLVNEYPDQLEFVTTSNGITEAFKKGKIGSLIGVEGGHSMDSRLGVLRMLYELGVRYMTLTHSCNTPWADSASVDSDRKSVHDLTNYGKLVVKEMNRLGMMVDLSHVSHNVMNQAIRESRAPVIFSHSSAYAIRNNIRNVQDDTLKLVKQNKGIVMVNFYSGFVCDNTPCTINDVIVHINHIVNVAGIQHVGIGADYDGISELPQGLEDVSKYPDLFKALQQQNSTLWTNENLKLLANGNLIRVFQAVEKVRDDLKIEEPQQEWIDDKDLNIENGAVWKCRTFHNNSSPNIPNGSLQYKAKYLITLLGILFLIFM